MRTLVVSDLHLGAGSGADLLHHPPARAVFLDAVREVDRLVILGDGLELREAAHRVAADRAGELFAEIGEALGPEGELVLSAGNHDHGLVAGWIDSRLLTEPPGFLGLEHRIEPHDAGPLAEALAARARPARTTLAYPGIYLRPDVYAFHGHQLDVHSLNPTFERLAAGAMARWFARVPDSGATPDHYEAVLSPLYAWIHQLTQRGEHGVVRTGGGASARVWVAVSRSGRRGALQRGLLRAGIATGVAAANRVGIGPVHSDLSGEGLRRGSLRGIQEVVRRLDIDAPYVIFGHSHRAGPWPYDDEDAWRTHAGGRLMNTGSWVFQRHFVAGPDPSRSPYWPGTAIRVDESGPPRLERMLTPAQVPRPA